MASYRSPTLLGLLIVLLPMGSVRAQQVRESRATIISGGWRLAGDLYVPFDAPDSPVPAIIMFNQAAGDRKAYAGLAEALARHGFVTLRVDLRGHGESTTLGRFDPSDSTTRRFIWNADSDVVAAVRYLRSVEGVDGEKIGVVSASYSGEEAAEAQRRERIGQAFVALSPGSFSDASIDALEKADIPWLFVVSNSDRYLHGIAAAIQERASRAEIIFVPGTKHGSDILLDRPDIAERIAVWFDDKLKP
jgi:dienelactone hydrolase